MGGERKESVRVRCFFECEKGAGRRSGGWRAHCDRRSAGLFLVVISPPRSSGKSGRRKEKRLGGEKEGGCLAHLLSHRLRVAGCGREAENSEGDERERERQSGAAARLHGVRPLVECCSERVC